MPATSDTSSRVREPDAAGALRRLVATALWKGHSLFDALRRLSVAKDTTRGWRPLSTLRIESPHVSVGVSYTPTPWLLLDWVHDAILPREERRHYTFVDYGAGKGRVVLSAVAAGYREAIGVDFAPELVEIAGAAILEAGIEPGRARVVEADAMQYELPPGPLVIYLFNPFGPPVLNAVAQRIAAAAARPDPVIVAYVNAVHRPLFDGIADLSPRKLGAVAAWRLRHLSPCEIVIYDNAGRASQRPAAS